MTLTTGKGHSYALDERAVPGVTTIISSGVAAPALVGWGISATSKYAVEHWEELAGLSIVERLKVLERAAYSERDEKSVRGQDLHKVLERGVFGAEVEVDESLLLAARQLTDFLDRYDVQPVLVERPVGNRTAWYAGTFDLIADMTTELGTHRWLLDLKSGKGVYESHVLQIAAYRFAEFYIDEAGNEKPMPAVEMTGVIHLRNDECTLFPVAADELAYKTFRHASMTARFVTDAKAAWKAGEPWPVGRSLKSAKVPA